jgi:hypothetical protein
MECTNTEIPSYLHWNNRKIFHDKDYFYFQKLYRIKNSGNPIEVPAQWINAISCKWSKVVKKQHILLQPEKKIGDEYDFVFVSELRKYKRESILNEQHEFMGNHVLTCVIKHSPLPCDFSHSEILIRHRVYECVTNKLIFDEIYSYESWQNKTAMLKKQKNKFFKDLKSNFRLDMIKLISRTSTENTLLNNFLAFLKFL